MSESSSSFWDRLRNVYGGLTNEETKLNLLNYVWGQMRIHGERNAPVLKNPSESKFIKSRRTCIRYENMQKIDGYLDATDNGFVIVLSKELKKNPLRLRTVIAHEIGHTFFYDVNSTPVKPICPIEESQSCLWKTHEGLAYEIGRNILVPRQILKKYLHFTPSVRELLELKSMFRVTFPILARQLVQENFWDAYIFRTNFDKNTSEYKPPKRNWRFKSKNTFKNFNLNSHWKTIQEKLNLLESASFQVKLGRKNYLLEIKFSADSNWIIGLLLPEKANL